MALLALTKDVVVGSQRVGDAEFLTDTDIRQVISPPQIPRSLPSMARPTFIESICSITECATCSYTPPVTS